jgi:hypothetical protein
MLFFVSIAYEWYSINPWPSCVSSLELICDVLKQVYTLTLVVPSFSETRRTGALVRALSVDASMRATVHIFCTLVHVRASPPVRAQREPRRARAFVRPLSILAPKFARFRCCFTLVYVCHIPSDHISSDRLHCV